MDGTSRQLDFFSPWGNPESYRDLLETMAYPFVSPSKNRDVRKPIQYEGKGVNILVTANATYGMATIWDWDLMIGFISMINEARKRGRKVSPAITFRPHDLLECIYRSNGGSNYRELVASIRRLSHTAITTNIRLDDQEGVEESFRFLEWYQIPKRYGLIKDEMREGVHHEPNPDREWKVLLSPWVYKAVVRENPLIKVISFEYFSLKGAIERFIYLLAHKAVQDSRKSFSFHMETLYRLSGSCGRFYDFQRKVCSIERSNVLPDYSIAVSGSGARAKVWLFRKTEIPESARDADQQASGLDDLFGPVRPTHELLQDEIPY